MILIFLFLCEVNAFPLDMNLDSWTKYTIPENHYVNIAEILTAYGDGVSVDTIGYPGAFDYGYRFFAYYDEVLVVPLSEVVEITGYFMYDDITPHIQRKQLFLYLLHSDLSSVINETRILDYSSGDMPGVWYYRRVVISNLTYGEEFRIALGRSDGCDMERRLKASWAAIDIFMGRKLMVPNDYLTIQDAITEASVGDTIEVAPGRYYEHLLVDKDDLRIIGQNSETTTIDANMDGGSNHAAVYITGKNVLLTGFTICNCPDLSGLAVYGENATLAGNRVTNNTIGISLFADHSTIMKNNISHNTQGVWMQSNIENSTLFYNNFFNNSQHFSFQQPAGFSSWDNGYAGNFWNNYTGLDLNGDGVGDTPHIIDSNNTDYYPLMNPYWNPADINHDLTVDIFDVVLAVNAYGSTPSDPNWNYHSDIAEPYRIINIFDILVVCSSYGDEYSLS